MWAWLKPPSGGRSRFYDGLSWIGVAQCVLPTSHDCVRVNLDLNEPTSLISLTTHFHNRRKPFFPSFQVDGAIARRYPSQRSLLGTVLDPLADKALVLTVVGCMGVVGAIPPALAMVMVGKDAGMVAISLWLRYASLKVRGVRGGET